MGEQGGGYMKMKLNGNKVAGLFLGLAMLVGIVAITSTTTYAQYGRDNNRRVSNWDGYPNWGGSYDLRQTALNAGFNEGSKEGAQDRAYNRRSNFNSFRAYQSATKDYNSRYGDRALYQRYFRLAFESGYNTELGIPNDRGGWNNNNNRYPDNRGIQRNRRGRNWDQYGQFGGSYQLRQTALNAGYNNGREQGRKDRDRNRAANYRTYKEYREATEDYSSRLGNRELYRRYFREGYDNGYLDGYEGY
jgi:hypothetical protein